MNLEGKKILFFTAQLFNYPALMKGELEKKGATVHMYDERNNPTSIEKILLRKLPFLMSKRTQSFYEKVADNELSFNPDYIFFVSPEAVTPKALQMLKRRFPKSRFILYMWDSVKNKHADKIIKYFDKTYSFDTEDCKKYAMKFRPLFFANDFKKEIERENYQYDFSFIGTVHSDRARILMDIKNFCDKNDLTYFFYLYVPGKLLLTLRRIFNPSLRKWDKSYIHTEPIAKEKVAHISSETKCIIDINHPDQTGLTMRTIEMLGLQRKICTTNKNIVNYDFYYPEDQIVIDRDLISMDKKMINEKYKPTPKEIYDHYSLSAWVNDIFELND